MLISKLHITSSRPQGRLEIKSLNGPAGILRAGLGQGFATIFFYLAGPELGNVTIFSLNRAAGKKSRAAVEKARKKGATAAPRA